MPGAPGIGIKTASALINEYGDLDTLLARAGEIKQDKRRQTLIDFADQIRLSRQLVTLDCDTPLPEPLDDLAVAARARRRWPSSWRRWSSAAWPGGWARRARRRAGRRRRRRPRRPRRPPIDHRRLCLRARSATLDAWIARARGGRRRRLRHRDRRRLARPTPTSAASRWPSARRGLLHPGRPLRGRGPGARGGGGPRPDPAGRRRSRG